MQRLGNTKRLAHSVFPISPHQKARPQLFTFFPPIIPSTHDITDNYQAERRTSWTIHEYTTDFAWLDLIMSSDISNGGGLYASFAFGGVVAILTWMMFFLSGKELNDISTWRIVKLLTGGVDMRARRRATQHFRVTRCTWIEASPDDEVRARERERW